MFTNLAHALLRYTIIKEVGDGTFGSVWRAINKESGEVVCRFTCLVFAFVAWMCSLLLSPH
jgi:hypothetical protein